MPIDPTIPLDAFVPQGATSGVIKTPSQIERDRALAQKDTLDVEEQQLKNTEMRQEAQDRFAMKKMLQETGGDVDKVIMRMMTVNPKLALELKEQKAKESKAAYDAISAQLDSFGKRVARGVQLAQGIHDQTTLQEIVPDIAELSPEVASYLGDTYDPDRVANVLNMGLTMEQMTNNRRDALKELATGSPQRALAGFLMTARTPEEWDSFYKSQTVLGIPVEYQKQMQQLFGDFSPANVQRAKDYWDRTGKEKASANPNNSQSKAFLLNGQRVMGDYVPGDGGPGKYFYNGQDVTGTAKDIPPSAASSTTAMSKDDSEEIIDMLVKGQMVPSTLTKRGNYNALIAGASRKIKSQGGSGYDAAKANLNYEAAKRFITSLNSSQQLRLKQVATSAVPLIDDVISAAEELKQGGVQRWNQAKRDDLTKIYGNTEWSGAAARYRTAVNALKAEFAQVESGGYAPTGEAWKLANDQINQNYGLRDMNAALGELRRIMTYRLNAMDEVSPSTYGGGPDVAGTRAEADRKASQGHGGPQGNIAADKVPAGIAAMKNAQKPVVVIAKDKKTGKAAQRWTIYPDGSATMEAIH